MAAFTGTPTKSVQYTAQTDQSFAQPSDVDSLLKAAFYSYTHTATEGSGTGEINLVKLPPGRIRVLPALSRLVTTQFAANADIHIGFRAYTERDGSAVGEDDNAFYDNGDAGGGTLDVALNLPAAGYKLFESRDGVVIYAMIDTGNIEADDTIEGWITYMQAK